MRYMQRAFPIELYKDSPVWEFAFKQFIEEAESQIPGASIIHVMVTGFDVDDSEAA